MKFTTRTEAVNHMVEKGVPLPLAKAVVNEQYNYDVEGDTRDLLQTINDDGPVPITQTPLELFMTWQTFDDMLADNEKGIYIDGELLYDVNGNHL